MRVQIDFWTKDQASVTQLDSRKTQIRGTTKVGTVTTRTHAHVVVVFADESVASYKPLWHSNPACIDAQVL